MASAAEIDRIGIIAALRLAGHRALAALPVRPDLVLSSEDRETPGAMAMPCRTPTRNA